MPVLGIGGLVFRAREPAALKAWYLAHLGVGGGAGVDESGRSHEWIWFVHGGPMVFEPVPLESDTFASDKHLMLTLRVSDLDGLIASLRAANLEVATRPEWDAMGLGRFARLHDPEGNPVELWEPATS